MISLTLVLFAIGLSWTDYLYGDDEHHRPAAAEAAWAAGVGGDASRARADPSDRERWSMLLLGVSAIPLCIRMLRMFTQHRILGVLMIILSKMMCGLPLASLPSCLLAFLPSCLLAFLPSCLFLLTF